MKNTFLALLAVVLLGATSTADAYYFQYRGTTYEYTPVYQRVVPTAPWVPTVSPCTEPAGWPSWIDHPCRVHEDVSVVPEASFGGGNLEEWPSWIGRL